MNIQELEPDVEVGHLRRVLDIQPSCLMRLAADGTVLAANDAALKLIGATSGAQVLGRDFSAWVPSDQRARWTAFTSGVVQGFPASIECEIAASSGDRQPTLFHGMPLVDHPDGVASMTVAARALAGQRQLEAAVMELEEQLRERDADRLKARARLAESETRQRELAEKVSALEAMALEASLRPAGASAELDEQVRQLKAELEARDAALVAAEAARRTAETKAAQAIADVQQLEVALDGFAARQKQMTAERAAERQRLTELTEAASSSHEQALNAARDTQERERLAARLEEREATVRALEAAWTEKLAELEDAQRVREALEAAHASLAAEHASLAAVHASLTAEHASLAAAHASLTAEHASLTAEHGTLGAEHESLAREHNALTADHASLTTEHGTLTAQLASLTAAHQALVSSLRRHAAQLDALANGFPVVDTALDTALDTAPDAHVAPIGFGTGREEGLA